MARRSKDWNKGLARDLRDPKFTREFLLAAVDEGISLQRALGKAVRAAGIKEFAMKIGMASPNLLRAINPRHNPTQATINRLLKPWGLRLSLAAIERTRRRHAAELRFISLKSRSSRQRRDNSDGESGVRPDTRLVTGREPGRRGRIVRDVLPESG